MKRFILLIGLTLLTGCGGGKLFVPQTTVQTNVVTEPSGQTITNLVTNVVFYVNPGVTNALGTAQQVAQQLPIPWNGLAAGVLAVASGVLGLIAKVKSDKAALLPAVIAGVEAAGNADVKKNIQTAAIAAGVQPALHREVQRLTS